MTMSNRGKYARGQNPRLRCPHCAGDVSIYYGVQLTRTYREVYYQCKDMHCGCTFKAGLEVIEIMSPSGKPNPHLRLPTKARTIPKEPYEGEPEHAGPDPPAEPVSLALPF
jgi:Ogr/Delta-like zinc finger